MAEMKLIAVLLIPLLCLIVPLTQAVNFHYCDKQADYDVFVQGVEINPHPVIRSQLATFTVNAYTGEAISGGKLVIDIKYFGVHIHQETHELCGETSCPVSAGSFVISHTEALPAFTPPGSYQLIMKVIDGENQKQMTCFSFEFRVKVGSSMEDS